MDWYLFHLTCMDNFMQTVFVCVTFLKPWITMNSLYESSSTLQQLSALFIIKCLFIYKLERSGIRDRPLECF